MGAGLWSLWSAAAGNAKLVYYYSLAVYSSVKLRWPAQISYATCGASNICKLQLLKFEIN